MELAADSISVKVSEAIMHMQENSIATSTKAGMEGGGGDGGRRRGLRDIIRMCYTSSVQ